MRAFLAGVAVGVLPAAAGFAYLALDAEQAREALESRVSRVERGARGARAEPREPERSEGRAETLALAREEVARALGAAREPIPTPGAPAAGSGVAGGRPRSDDGAAFDARLAALEVRVSELAAAVATMQETVKRVNETDERMRRMFQGRGPGGPGGPGEHEAEAALTPEERARREQEREQRELEEVREYSARIRQDADMSDMDPVSAEKFALAIQEQFADQRRLMEEAEARGEELSWRAARDRARETTDSKLATFLPAEELRKFKTWRENQGGPPGGRRPGPPPAAPAPAPVPGE